MKQEIVSAPILAYYNPKKQTALQTDVSIKGLGALPVAGGKTSLLCKQSFDQVTDRNRITCSCLGDREASSFPVCKPIHIGN